MQVMGLLGIYFDAVVVEVEKYLLFIRLAPAIHMYCGRIVKRESEVSLLKSFRVT